MRRLSPPLPKEQALQQFLRMKQEGLGLAALLAKLPPGSTLDDARRQRRIDKQRTRTPSALLDSELGSRRAILDEDNCSGRQSPHLDHRGDTHEIGIVEAAERRMTSEESGDLVHAAGRLSQRRR